MSSKLNKSRHPMFYGSSQCLNCGTSCPSGAKKCRRCNMPISILEERNCISEEEKSLGLLPNSVKEELNLIQGLRHEVAVRSVNQLGCTQSLSKSSSAPVTASRLQTYEGTRQAVTCPDQRVMLSAEAKYLSQMWEKGVWNDGADVKVFNDTSAQASFSLDAELEMHYRDQVNVHAVMDNGADFSSLAHETPPEYYSLNSTASDHSSTQWSDATESLEPGYNDSLVATKGSTVVSSVDSVALGADSLSFNSSDWTDYTENNQDLCNETDSGCRPKTDEYRRLNDEGLSSSKALNSEVPCSITCTNASCSGSDSGCKLCTPDGVSVPEESFYSECSSELNIKSSTHSETSEQTLPIPLTVNQAVDATGDFRACFTSTQSTEVDQNSGTDSFTTNHEQTTQTTQMQTSEKCTITEVYMSDLDAVCEAFKNFKMMEEELKHLKEKMARTSVASDGGPVSTGLKCDCDCDAVCRARRAEPNLLALQFGVCQQHCWRCFYTSPLGETALQGFSDLKDECQIDEATDRGPLSRTTAPPQDITATWCNSKGVNNKKSRAVYLPVSSGTNTDVPKDLNSSETWFDAEEELGSASQSCEEEKQTGQQDSRDTNLEKKGEECVNRMKHQSSLLCVTDLPIDVTEPELFSWFEKYHAIQVSIATFSNNSRAAIVSVKSPGDAEAAVKEMNGRKIQDHSLHVEHIHRSAAGGPGLIKAACAEHSPADCKAEEPSVHASKCYSRSSRQCDHMSGFDTLMIRLSERHPETSRESIVGALMELRVKHGGFLSGLPMRAIEEMTSDLLTLKSNVGKSQFS